MDLALNNQQWLTCHKTQTINHLQQNKKKHIFDASITVPRNFLNPWKKATGIRDGIQVKITMGELESVLEQLLYLRLRKGILEAFLPKNQAFYTAIDIGEFYYNSKKRINFKECFRR